MKISLIIPTLNAQDEIGALLDNLLMQTRVPDQIIVIDSASDDATVEEVTARPVVELIKINRSEFNHGLTRDMALKRSVGDIVCFMTQDAVPANEFYVENLVAPLISDNRIVASSGRQLPKADARRFEQLVRGFNYADESSVKTFDDVKRIGIKAYFATDVCSAYKRDLYLKLGGFCATDMSEDMYLAAKAINAGYKVAYAADAEVYHSHNLSPKQQYVRNFTIGRFLERNKDLLVCESEVGEGKRLASNVAKTLISERNFTEFVAFGVDCAARYLGNKKGRAAARKEMERR